MNQGKKPSQIKDSETFSFIALVIISLILAIIAGLCSCSNTAQSAPKEEEKIWIHMSDGDSVELVADEYGSQYIKQESSIGVYVYIPYMGETEEEDTLRFFNVKNK